MVRQCWLADCDRPDAHLVIARLMTCARHHLNRLNGTVQGTVDQHIAEQVKVARAINESMDWCTFAGTV